MTWNGPVLDNHLHLDGADGRGMAAVDEFVAAGGTHLIVINKPSWWYGVEVDERADFRVGFEATIDIVERASQRLPGTAWAFLGVHPALVTRLTDDRNVPMESAISIMRDGLELAAEYVENDDALGLKSGRPHYPVEDEVWRASNDLIRYTLSLAATADCCVQLHTEQGRDFTEVARWARSAGVDPDRVVKHYADGPIEGVVPSVIARKDALDAIDAGSPFLMETDYLDDPSRPGAVLGPKTVPRRVEWLAEGGHLDHVEVAHVETPEHVYGIDTEATHEG